MKLITLLILSMAILDMQILMLMTYLRVLMPLEVRAKLPSSLINLNSGGKNQMPLSPEDHKLLTDLYREDILRLQDLIHRDLSPWLGEK